jgi:hypothetical protein
MIVMPDLDRAKPTLVPLRAQVPVQGKNEPRLVACRQSK